MAPALQHQETAQLIRLQVAGTASSGTSSYATGRCRNEITSGTYIGGRASGGFLTGGSIKIQGMVTAGPWRDLTTFAIPNENSSQTVQVPRATLESTFAGDGFADGKTIFLRAEVTDRAGNTAGPLTFGPTFYIDQNDPAQPNIDSVTVQGAPVVAGYWNASNTNVQLVVDIDEADPTLQSGTLKVYLDSASAPTDTWVSDTVLPGVLPATVTVNVAGGTLFTLMGGNDNRNIHFYARVEDVAGNESIDSADSASVYHDETIPTIGSVSISTNNGFDANWAIPASNTTTLNFEPSETVTVTAASIESIDVLGSLVFNDPDYDVTWAVPGSHPEKINFVFSISVVDPAGNPRTKTTTDDASWVQYDETVPTVTNVILATADNHSWPLDTSNRITSEDPFTIVISFNEDVIGLADGELDLGSGWSDTAPSPGTGTWTASYTSDINPDADEDGTVDINVDAVTDRAGLQNPASATYTFTRDTGIDIVSGSSITYTAGLPLPTLTDDIVAFNKITDEETGSPYLYYYILIAKGTSTTEGNVEGFFSDFEDFQALVAAGRALRVTANGSATYNPTFASGAPDLTNYAMDGSSQSSAPIVAGSFRPFVVSVDIAGNRQARRGTNTGQYTIAIHDKIKLDDSLQTGDNTLQRDVEVQVDEQPAGNVAQNQKRTPQTGEKQAAGPDLSVTDGTGPKVSGGARPSSMSPSAESKTKISTPAAVEKIVAEAIEPEIPAAATEPVPDLQAEAVPQQTPNSTAAAIAISSEEAFEPLATETEQLIPISGTMPLFTAVLEVMPDPYLLLEQNAEEAGFFHFLKKFFAGVFESLKTFVKGIMISFR